MLATLLPQALGITIPMALLVGILIALGRLSGDREIVAMEACGISLGRLLRPLVLFGVIATAATTYVMIVALPFANQAFREITFKLMMTRGETKIKPRVFYTEFPNLVIYVREVTPGVGWTDVMVSENSTPTQPKTYLAKKGRLILDESKRTVQMVLLDGTHHSVNLDDAEKYEEGRFEQTTLVIDPESVFPRTGPMKGYTEMTIAELKADMAELRKQNIYPHNQIMAWQKKYSIPAACLAFMLVALGMGVSHRRDGRLAAFVLGICVVFVYWVLMYMSEAIAKAGVLPYWFAWLAMWVPNIVVALWGLVLIVRKLRSPEESSMKLPLPFVRRRARSAPAHDATAASARGTRVVVVVKIPHIAFPRPSILDWYVLKQGLRVSVLAGAGLLGLFYIASFIDLSDHLFTGRASGFAILTYLWWATPQFMYYLVPLAVLMGALVTIGALTKNTELVVMKACGISLYRAAAPLLILALIGSAILLGLEEGVLAVSNRRADAIKQHDSRALSDDDRPEPALGDVEQRQRVSVFVFRAWPEPPERAVDFRVRQEPVNARAPQILFVRDLQRRPGGQGTSPVAGCERMGARLRAEATLLVIHQPDGYHGRPGLLRQRAAGCAVHVVSATQRTRHVARSRRIQRGSLCRCAPPEARLPVRHAHHGVDCGAVRRDDRQTRRHVWHWRGHRTGDSLLDDDQRFRRDWRRRPDGSGARRVGPEHHLRLRGDVSPADGPYLKYGTSTQRHRATEKLRRRCSSLRLCASVSKFHRSTRRFSSVKFPAVPGIVFVVSTTNNNVSASAGSNVPLDPIGVISANRTTTSRGSSSR